MFSKLRMIGTGMVIVAGATTVVPAEQKSSEIDFVSESHRELRSILVKALDLKGTWVSVHAAEALISLGEMDEVRQVFEPQSETSESKYRVGVWRVLARSAPDAMTRDRYVGRIRRILRTPEAVDQLHAVEALAKLGVSLNGTDRNVIERMAFSTVYSEVPFAVWCLHNSGDNAVALQRLPVILKSNDPVARGRVAYSLWQMKMVTPETRPALEAALAVEPLDSAVRPTLIAALGGPRNREQLINGTTAGARYLAAISLADTARSEDLSVLQSLTNEQDVDVQVAFAYAILRCQALTTD